MSRRYIQWIPKILFVLVLSWYGDVLGSSRSQPYILSPQDMSAIRSPSWVMLSIEAMQQLKVRGLRSQPYILSPQDMSAIRSSSWITLSIEAMQQLKGGHDISCRSHSTDCPGVCWVSYVSTWYDCQTTGSHCACGLSNWKPTCFDACDDLPDSNYHYWNCQNYD